MNVKKLLALVLALALVLCTFPAVFAAVADDAGDNPEDIETPIQGLPTGEDVLYGDLDADGRISTRDSLLLAKYLENMTSEIVEEAADVNADNVITEEDFTKLMKYLAGWDVFLGTAE